MKMVRLIQGNAPSHLLSAKSDHANPVMTLKCIDNVNTSCLHYNHGCVFRSQWHHFWLE